MIEIYSAADAFVNCTYEDNFPTVNLEALACGTPVLTYRTGGSPECLDDYCGKTIEQGDILSMAYEIEKITKREKNSMPCIRRAKSFDRKMNRLEFLRLYEG